MRPVRIENRYGQTYEEWIEGCDKECDIIAGISIYDLPDWKWYNTWSLDIGVNESINMFLEYVDSPM